MEEESGRLSIWSVRTKNRPLFAALFSVLFVAGALPALIYEIFIIDSDGVFETLFEIIGHILPIGLASVILAFFAIEGGDTVGVALEIFRKQRYADGRESLAAELLKKAKESGESMPAEIEDILKMETSKSRDKRK